MEFVPVPFRSAARLARRRLSRLLSLGGLALLIAATAAIADAGSLTQPPDTAGCISEDGSGPCIDGHGLPGGVDAVAVSPDGRSVYATTHSAVARFTRDRST